MSSLFAGLAAGCLLAIIGLFVGTLALIGHHGPTNWMAAAIFAWVLVGTLILGALFALAAYGTDKP